MSLFASGGPSGEELFEAIENLNLKKLKKITSKKKNVKLLDERDGQGFSPLTASIKTGSYEVFSTIFQFYKTHKKDINHVDKTGYTALHCAASMVNDDRILMDLLEYPGINVNIRNNDLNTPLHYLCEKFSSPDLQPIFESFLERGCKIDEPNKNQETPLHKAMFNKKLRGLIVRLLITNGADINKATKSGETVLHYAVRMKRDDLVSLLIKSGARMDIKNGEGVTPLELAKSKFPGTSVELVLTQAQELFDWLKSFNMEMYFHALIEREITLDSVNVLDHKQLSSMGVYPEHSEEFLRACRKVAQKKTEVLKQEIIKLAKHVDLAKGNWEVKYEDLEFTEKLGTGTFGKVYRGLYNGAEIAIKQFQRETQNEFKEFAKDFVKEFEVMIALDSPFVVKFFGACLTPNICIVMELCSKGSLFRILTATPSEKEWTIIGWDLVFSILKDITQGVMYLHSYQPQIVHRDLKTLNLLVNSEWRVKLADFGLSRFSTESSTESLYKMKSTYSYCAPEVFNGNLYSPSSDIYACSIVFFEIIGRCINGTYTRPYGGLDGFQILLQSATKNRRPVMLPGCPLKLWNLMASMWDANPTKRPTANILYESIIELEAEYKSHTEEWNKLAKT